MVAQIREHRNLSGAFIIGVRALAPGKTLVIFRRSTHLAKKIQKRTNSFRDRAIFSGFLRITDTLFDIFLPNTIRHLS